DLALRASAERNDNRRATQGLCLPNRHAGTPVGIFFPSRPDTPILIAESTLGRRDEVTAAGWRGNALASSRQEVRIRLGLCRRGACVRMRTILLRFVLVF